MSLQISANQSSLMNPFEKKNNLGFENTKEVKFIILFPEPNENGKIGTLIYGPKGPGFSHLELLKEHFLKEHPKLRKMITRSLGSEANKNHYLLERGLAYLGFSIFVSIRRENSNAGYWLLPENAENLKQSFIESLTYVSSYEYITVAKIGPNGEEDIFDNDSFQNFQNYVYNMNPIITEKVKR